MHLVDMGYEDPGPKTSSDNLLSSIMAASSPAPSNKVGDALFTSLAINGNLKSISLDTPKQNLRGLNKPKCSKCGNVARSRCPFQSCKSCCAKAQNPCPIHVLKQNSTLPDKPLPSTIPSFEQQSTDTASSGASWRLTALRQLSAAYANSLRARKPLTRKVQKLLPFVILRELHVIFLTEVLSSSAVTDSSLFFKDAINTNKWRFSKLKEHIEGNIEVENEAFERYLQNVRFLEEVFSTNFKAKSLDQSTVDPTSDDKVEKLITSMKAKQKSNTNKAASIRERMQKLVNEKLRKLQESEHVIDQISSKIDELNAYRNPKKLKKFEDDRAEKTMVMDDLIDKLYKARSLEDIESGLEMKLKSNVKVAEDHSSSKEEDASDLIPSFPLSKLCNVVHISQNEVSDINAQISSTLQLAEL
ncbi:hypothetical protein AXF42_Ash010023 [Apostasia shenzhenica]|uniref:Uncharacterized protein n=1 Tax=Apostasia shenzhenica TaxID=1088818 RepID=A0A2I0ACM2_9ASPA|nr:hypothetical protein AXF42_Ash010023 [Apostasia shenzhenica]